MSIASAASNRRRRLSAGVVGAADASADVTARFEAPAGEPANHPFLTKAGPLRYLQLP
jgi:hypothetical protein